jgi:hypothetical protein
MRVAAAAIVESLIAAATFNHAVRDDRAVLRDRALWASRRRQGPVR